MPLYEVTLNDGRKFRVDADSEPSEDEVMAAIGGGQQQRPSFTETLARGLGGAGPISGFGNPMAGVTAQQGSPEYQQQLADVAQGAREGLAQGARLVGPLAAPGAGLATLAATAGGSELLAQIVGGEQINPRAVVARTAQGAIPVVGVGGFAGRSIANAAAQGAGSVGAQLIEKGSVDPAHVALSTLMGGGVGAAQVAIPAMASGKKFLAMLMRPFKNVQAETEADLARQAIKSITGEEVPKSMGEVLGTTTFGVPYTEIEGGLKNATGALSDEARNTATRSVMYAAGVLAPSGATKEQIGRLAIKALEDEIGPVSEAAKKEIGNLSSALESRIKRSVAEASGLTTPTTEISESEFGNLKKQFVSEAQTAWRQKNRDLFNAVRDELGTDPVQKLPNANAAIDEVEKSGLLETITKESKSYDAYGNPVAKTTEDVVPINKTINDQVRGIIDEIRRAGSTPQKLESIRGYISDLNDNIHYGVDSGRGDAMLKKVVSGLKKDLAEGIDALPSSSAKAKLKEANDFFSGEGQEFGVDEILNRSVVSAGKEFAAGGTAPENLFNAITSRESVYNKYKTLLADKFPALQSKLRDAVLTQAQASAQPIETGGQINIGSLVKSMKSIPANIRKDLGLPIDDLRKIADDELKASGLLKGLQGKNENLLDWMKANETELSSYTSKAAFKDAVRAKAAEQELFNNRIMRDAVGSASERPADFVDTIISKSIDSRDVEKAVQAIARHDPTTMQDIQARMLEKIMEKSRVEGVINGEAISKLLSPVRIGAKAGEGAFYESANAILGNRRTSEIKEVADLLAKVQKPAQRGTLFAQLTGDGVDADFAWSVIRKSGGSAPMAVLRDAVSMPAKAKYIIASKYLNNPEGRAVLAKPVDELNPAQAQKLVNVMQQAIH